MLLVTKVSLNYEYHNKSELKIYFNLPAVSPQYFGELIPFW